MKPIIICTNPSHWFYTSIFPLKFYCSEGSAVILDCVFYMDCNCYTTMYCTRALFWMNKDVWLLLWQSVKCDCLFILQTDCNMEIILIAAWKTLLRSNNTDVARLRLSDLRCSRFSCVLCKITNNISWHHYKFCQMAISALLRLTNSALLFQFKRQIWMQILCQN